MLSGKDRSVMQRATLTAIAVVTLLTLLASWVFYRQNLAIVAARDWVNHTYEVKVHIQELQSRLRDAVAGARSYMFTGDQAFLVPYYDAIRQSSATEATATPARRLSIAEEMAFLRRETADNPIQQKSLDEMEPLERDLLAYLASALERHKAETAPTMAELDPHPTRQYLDRLRGMLANMTDEENRLLAERNQADLASIHKSNALIFTCIGVFYILLVLAIWIYQRMRQIAQDSLLRYAKQLKQSEEELKMQQEELKASNEEIESSNEELEEQNAQIRQQAEELRKSKQLVEQKAREVEQASKYKTEFLANMSHELRTPLNSLLILSRSLASNEDGNLSAEQIEEASIIHHDGLELLTLINDILDLSKVEAGKLNFVAEDIEVEGIVNRLRQQFAAIAKERNVSFPIVVDEGLPESIHTDAHRAEQILKNLLANAFKFTSSGSVTLRVHRPRAADVQRASLKGHAIAFSVADTGIGIDASRFQDIFEAFQQEDGSTDRHYGGTGLGLTIARKFAHLLGGEIHVESEKGAGSTFTLILPAKGIAEKDKSVGETGAAEIAAAMPEAKTPRPLADDFIPDDRRSIGEKDRILLIVEDDRRFATTLMKIARKRGYKCLAAGTGKAALLLAAAFPVTAIILDLKLPDIGGMQVLDLLKNDLRLRHIPVHIVTGTAPAGNVVPLHKGAIGYLTKPVAREGIEDAFARIEALLQAEMKHILVIEDGRQSQIAIRNLLEKKDIRISIAATGGAGLEQVQAERFDCVILDLRLPDMSGFDWLERAEKQAGSAGLPPLIVYTAQDLTEDETRILSRYTGSIIIKGTKSPERLLDEVTLFLHSVESSLPQEQRDMIRMQHHPDKVLQGRTILLADDDMRNTFALSKLLKKHGLAVVIAENGQMALDKLREDGSIDLVIMDLMMPVMDGYQAMREIRAQRQFAHVPIIALTARAMPEEQEKCIEAGANDYMTKPVDIERLLTLLRVWLYRQERAI